MEIEAYITQIKDIQASLIDYIDATDDSNGEFDALIGNLEKQNILQNIEEIRLLLQLISKIADNHHLTSNFSSKLERIFRYLIKDIPSPISNFIPNYRKYNKRILFLLLEKKFIKPDDSFINNCLQNETNKYYFYPVIKDFVDETLQKQIEEEITEKFDVDFPKFAENCQIGENDSYVCTLIRSDLVEDFISYVTRTNLSLLTRIIPTFYETNSFLINKNPTLIEYAAFYGSIQIIQYLKYNNVPLTSSLWIYAIHSNNAVLIHFLEENKVKIVNNINDNDGIFIESIKCHHNNISNYIKDRLYEQEDDQNKFYDNFSEIIINSLNFFFYPNEISSIISKPRNDKGFNLSNLCFSLKQVTIPSSVTEIGYGAFKKCSKLTKITIPSSVTIIDDYAFYECSSLTQINIPSSVTKICDYTFYECSSLTEISIPSSVIEIGSYSFFGCSSLTQIMIPSSVTTIGKCVFNRIEKFEIKGDFKRIPDNLFYGCSTLKQIIIPSCITEIGNNAFRGCSSLEQFSIPPDVTIIGNNAFDGCSKLKQITIPSCAILIGSYVFSGCSSLTEMEIPSSITSIGDGCFEECSSLKKISIPPSVTSIGNYSFHGCSSLLNISIPSLVNSIGENTFSECSSLTEFNIPPSVVSIGPFAFHGCSSLIDIKIPSSVTSIGDYAFYGCSSLTEIRIPSSVVEIGTSPFDGCSSLKNILFESNSS